MPACRSVKLEHLVEHLRSQSLSATLVGEGQTVITSVNTLDDAGPSELSFLSNPKYEKYLATTRAAVVIVGPDTPCPQGMMVIRTDDPYAAFMASVVLVHGYRQHPKWSIHPQASVSASADVGKNPNIGPHVTLEDHVIIGDNVVLYPGCYIGSHSKLGNNVVCFPNVVIYEGCVIGNNVVLHGGTVVGEDGLGYAPVREEWKKIPQVGSVVIEDDVEIGANCTIDRATLGSTVVGRGSKFSNLIAIGHGTKIGPNAMFVAQVGLAGSVTVGKHVQMGGQVGVTGHVVIGDHATIGAKAGVANDVDAHTFVLGQPAIKASEAKRAISLTQKLPEMKQRLRALEHEVAELRATIMAESGQSSRSAE